MARANGQALGTKVKVACLFNFTRFVEWPEAKLDREDISIKICVLGEDPFGPLLQTIEQKMVKGRPLKVVYIDKANEINSCHMVFISNSEEENLEYVLNHFKGMGVLTVSDMRSFAARGGMIGFVMKKGKIGIEINQKIALNEGLKVSGKLLEIATIVK